MDKKGCEQVIVQSLKNVGIDAEINIDSDLREFLSDSLLFISFVVELEERLGFELPFELLIIDNFSSLHGFIAMLEGLDEAS